MGGPDRIPSLIASFVAIGDGAAWDAVGLEPDQLAQSALDIRAYYEEAALALTDHVPAARQAESWFYRSTATEGSAPAGSIDHSRRRRTLPGLVRARPDGPTTTVTRGDRLWLWSCRHNMYERRNDGASPPPWIRRVLLDHSEVFNPPSQVGRASPDL